ncbi:STYKc [Musa troglodytarum]|uniref:STYKc n=1 Tax=Musa troglodytarum TaxID=320322 RepID=A0A9E7G2K8_9LILI|nr:STYKc [Musa troglodytarum]
MAMPISSSSVARIATKPFDGLVRSASRSCSIGKIHGDRRTRHASIRAALITEPDAFEVGRFVGSYGFMNITRSLPPSLSYAFSPSPLFLGPLRGFRRILGSDHGSIRIRLGSWGSDHVTEESIDAYSSEIFENHVDARSSVELKQLRGISNTFGLAFSNSYSSFQSGGFSNANVFDEFSPGYSSEDMERLRVQDVGEGRVKISLFQALRGKSNPRSIEGDPSHFQGSRVTIVVVVNGRGGSAVARGEAKGEDEEDDANCRRFASTSALLGICVILFLLSFCLTSRRRSPFSSSSLRKKPHKYLISTFRIPPGSSLRTSPHRSRRPLHRSRRSQSQ